MSWSKAPREQGEYAAWPQSSQVGMLCGWVSTAPGNRGRQWLHTVVHTAAHSWPHSGQLTAVPEREAAWDPGLCVATVWQEGEGQLQRVSLPRPLEAH